MDWTNPDQQVTPHFTVKDCLFLHNWNRLATPEDGADFDKLSILCQKMEEVRTILGCPVTVHCMYRSPAYNLEQGILPPTGVDVHAMNLACDFDCAPHLTTDEVKAKLISQLEQLGIRMENNGTGASWIHIDLHAVIYNRFFNI